jgi:allophanate hydrolase
MSKSPASGPADGPTIDELTNSYRTTARRPSDVVDEVLGRIADRGNDGTWISVAERTELLLLAKQLEAHPDPESLPLYGIPFGVKDSIDVAGVPTTLACPDYAYVPQETAPAVQRLIEAGALYIGKTNLDQFATGLNGTRTPYAVPRSVFGGGLISGGSSSGSALAVAAGDVPFAVATDTAGSGRVPPALNGIVGLKPSRGLISTVGLVPACRSLDCISLMARTVPDVATVLDVVAAPDDRDPHSRARRREAFDLSTVRVGLPDVGELDFFGDAPMRDAHLAARARIGRTFGRIATAPFGPFLAAGELLYQGPWVAERLTEFGDFLAGHPDSVLPVVRTIIEGGGKYSAVDVFAAEHRLGALKAQVRQLWRAMDVLVLPAIGTTFTVEQVLADPIGTNTVLGHYTHFGNLLDLCAAVVPAGLTADGRPAALMVLGPALADDRVLAVAGALSGHDVPPSTAAADEITLVVVGHHLAGQPRSTDLIERGGRLIETTATATGYRLLRTGGAVPVPVLVSAPDGGAAIEVETWRVPPAALPEILARSSPSVCLGRVELSDGRTEIGFVADTCVLDDEDLADITAFGGWRAYLTQHPDDRTPTHPGSNRA